jgi:hypothetical protein
MQTLLTQAELISIYDRLASEDLGIPTPLYSHREHLLLALKRWIESFGPTTEYDKWFNSISTS